MPCLLALLMIAFPRLAIVLLWLFTTFFDKVYSSIFFLILGFVFLPLTTIVYAYIVNGHHAVSGIYLVALVISVLADLGLLGGAARRR